MAQIVEVDVAEAGVLQGPQPQPAEVVPAQLPAAGSGEEQPGPTRLGPAPAEIVARLGIGEGELCVRTVYEFLADGRPVQLSTSWEPYDLTGWTLVVYEIIYEIPINR